MTSSDHRLGPRASLVAVLGLAVLLAGIAYAGWSTAAEDDAPTAPQRPRLDVGVTTVEGELLPGGAVTGSLVVSNGADRALRVASARFTPAVTPVDGCAGAVLFALTVEPSAATPLVLPPGAAAAPLGWTAFMAGDAAASCQGARFTSTLVLDGHEVGPATAVAARLPAPGQALGGLTTSSRAAVRWSPAPGVPAYLLERAPAGTADWEPACGSALLASASCTDTGLEPGTAYAYRVTSVRGSWRAVGRLSPEVTTLDC